MTEVDLFVIGGGSGGVRAARIAATHGARVAIAEERRWGGTCVIRGCVPKKLLVYGSAVSAQLEDARGFGWQIDGARFDWPALRDAVDREVTRLSGAYQGSLDKRGAERIEGRARLVDAHTVEVGARRFRARHVLVATGGAPRRLAIPGGERAITSDEVFTLPALPRRLVIVGAGYIGVEFAHVFAGLGVEVALVHHGDLPLRGFDHEVREAAAANLRGRGVALHPHCEPTRIDDGLRVTTSEGEVLEADLVLAAIGRAPQSAGFGLEELGVARDAGGGVVVDQWQRTSVDGIAAVGDVTGRLALTPIAIREGHAYADTVFGGRPTPFVPDHVPTAVFAQPPIATVGLTEAEARARGGEVAIHRASFRPLRHGLTGRAERVLMKAVCDAPTGRVLGLHMVGDDAPEIIQAAAIAVTMGATKADLDRTVALHPTVAEELVLLP
jgi:glutathione reductase (NADPH)